MRIFRTLPLWAAIFLSAAAIALLWGSAKGLAGLAIGLVSAAFGVTGLFFLNRLLEVGASKSRKGGAGAGMAMITFAAKIPVYIVAGMLAKRIGGAAFTCFLAGIILVYSAVVVWASASPSTPISSSDGSSAA